jgi:glycerophosphoryl diester phosphodiesterase
MPLPLLLATLLVLLACPMASRAAGANPWLERRFLNMAHAGGEHEAPTDTLFADKRALAAGANLIELDVRRTKDGALIMSHDDTADRVTDGTGSWLDLTLEQVKRLDNAYNFECTASCEGYGDERHPLRGIATGQRPPRRWPTCCGSSVARTTCSSPPSTWGSSRPSRRARRR